MQQSVAACSQASVGTRPGNSGRNFSSRQTWHSYNPERLVAGPAAISIDTGGRRAGGGSRNAPRVVIAVPGGPAEPNSVE